MRFNAPKLRRLWGTRGALRINFDHLGIYEIFGHLRISHRNLKYTGILAFRLLKSTIKSSKQVSWCRGKLQFFLSGGARAKSKFLTSVHTCFSFSGQSSASAQLILHKTARRGVLVPTCKASYLNAFKYLQDQAKKDKTKENCIKTTNKILSVLQNDLMNNLPLNNLTSNSSSTWAASDYTRYKTVVDTTRY